MIYAISIALVICCLIMLFLWIYYLQTDNASIVDVGWSLNVGIGVYISFSFLPEIETRQLFILLAALLWSIRLTLYLGKRNLSGREDGRYIDIKKRWAGPHIHWKFLGFFQLQALIDIVLIVPFVYMIYNPSPSQILDFSFFILACICIIGEAIADYQLQAFKDKTRTRGKQVCDEGLWKYSRHPNYFFEISYWIIIAAWALQYKWGFVFIIVPLMMAFFILRVTGIPETEAQNIRTKGAAYKDYVLKTSPLIPWFPKRRT